ILSARASWRLEAGLNLCGNRIRARHRGGLCNPIVLRNPDGGPIPRGYQSSGRRGNLLPPGTQSIPSAGGKGPAGTYSAATAEWPAAPDLECGLLHRGGGLLLGHLTRRIASRPSRLENHAAGNRFESAVFGKGPNRH